MPILHSFEESKLEYEDEDEVEIKMMRIRMDKESLEIDSICHIIMSSTDVDLSGHIITLSDHFMLRLTGAKKLRVIFAELDK
ncbi:hypothetical protein Tco_0731090 [Tanacetum coccineum]